MRLDKFLKISRIIKRRTIAKEFCDNQRVSINSKLAKSSSEVKVGDIIEIKFGVTITKYRVLKIVEFVKKDEASELFEIL